MPHLQAMIEQANFAFNRENIGGVEPALFAPGTNLAESLAELGILRTAPEMAFFMRFTRGEAERIRVTIADALDTGSPSHAGYRLPIQSAWKASYDYAVEFAESSGTADSIGGVTIIFRTPYPGGSPLTR